MARQARAEQTRAAIIESAAELLDGSGYAATSLGDIIARAGVTKGALYFHFESKEGLALAVIQEQRASAMAQMKAVTALGRPALEKLILISCEFAADLLDSPIVRAGIRLTLENGTFQQPLAEPYLDWISTCTELLDRAAGEDLRTGVEHQRVARFIVGAFTGVQVVAQVLNNRQDLAEALADMWRIVLPGLVPARKLPHYIQFAGTAAREIRRQSARAGT